MPKFEHRIFVKKLFLYIFKILGFQQDLLMRNSVFNLQALLVKN